MRWKRKKKRKTPRPKHQNIKTYPTGGLYKVGPHYWPRNRGLGSWTYLQYLYGLMMPYDTHRFINHILSLYGSFPSQGGTPSSHPFHFRISFINHPFLGTSSLGNPNIAYIIFELFIYDFSSEGTSTRVRCSCATSCWWTWSSDKELTLLESATHKVLKKTTPYWGFLSHRGSPKSWIFKKKCFPSTKASSYWGSPIESWPVLVEVFRAMKIAQQGSEQVTRSPMTHGGFIIHKKPRGRARKLGWVAKYESWWGSHLFWPQSKHLKKVIKYVNILHHIPIASPNSGRTMDPWGNFMGHLSKHLDSPGNHQHLSSHLWRPREFCVGCTTFRCAVPGSVANCGIDRRANATRSRQCQGCSNQRRWWTSSADRFDKKVRLRTANATAIPMLKAKKHPTTSYIHQFPHWFLRFQSCVQMQCPRPPVSSASVWGVYNFHHFDSEIHMIPPKARSNATVR